MVYVIDVKKEKVHSNDQDEMDRNIHHRHRINYYVN